MAASGILESIEIRQHWNKMGINTNINTSSNHPLMVQKIVVNSFSVNPLSVKITKWSNTLKQFVDKLPTNCLSVFDHFVTLVLKGLKYIPCAGYAIRGISNIVFEKGTQYFTINDKSLSKYCKQTYTNRFTKT